MYTEKSRGYVRKVLKEIEPVLFANELVSGFGTEEITIDQKQLEGIVISLNKEASTDELLKNLEGVTYYERVPFYQGVPIKIEVGEGIEPANQIIKTNGSC